MFLIFWYLLEKCHKSEPFVTSEEPTDNQINSIETIENSYVRHQTNGSQKSLTTYETSLPAKNEKQPSFSQDLIVREWIDRKLVGPVVQEKRTTII